MDDYKLQQLVFSQAGAPFTTQQAAPRPTRVNTPGLHHFTGLDQRLSEHDEQHVGGRAFLHDSLRLLTDAHHAYKHSNDGNRRLANQAFYTRLEITEDEQLRPRLAEPFATIVHEATGGKEAKREHSTSSDVACSRKTLWVARAGIEPATFHFSGERCYQLSYLASRRSIQPHPGDPDGTRTRDLRRDRAAR